MQRIYEFGSDAAGLHFTITADIGPDGTSFTVNVLEGLFNLNALYWAN
jgi:hypothetical protein